MAEAKRRNHATTASRTRHAPSISSMGMRFEPRDQILAPLTFRRIVNSSDPSLPARVSGCVSSPVTRAMYLPCVCLGRGHTVPFEFCVWAHLDTCPVSAHPAFMHVSNATPPLPFTHHACIFVTLESAMLRIRAATKTDTRLSAFVGSSRGGVRCALPEPNPSGDADG